MLHRHRFQPTENLDNEEEREGESDEYEKDGCHGDEVPEYTGGLLTGLVLEE